MNRIDSLEPPVQTNNEEIQIHAQTYAITYGYLLVKLIKFKLSTRLFFVVAQSPDITDIYKSSSTEFPEEARAVLNVCIEFDITRLIQKVSALTSVAPGPNSRTDQPRTLLAPPEK